MARRYDYLFKLATEVSKKRNLLKLYDNQEWLQKQMKKNKLTPEQVSRIPMLMEAAQMIYPNEWDIQFPVNARFKIMNNLYFPIMFFAVEDYNSLLVNYGEDGALLRPRRVLDMYENITQTEFQVFDYFESTVSLVIHWPELLISNHLNNSNLLRDLFLQIHIDREGQISLDIQGARSTYSMPEMAAGYMHSHLPSISFSGGSREPLSYQKFCKGSGPIISAINLFNADPNMGNLVSVLYHIRSMASRESLDGGPHIHMSEVSNRSSNIPVLDVAVLRSRYSRLLRRATSPNFNQIDSNGKVIPKEVDWNHSNGKYYIVDNDKFNDFCVTYLKDDSSDDTGNVLVFRDMAGKYYKIPSYNNMRYTPPEDQYIPFKQQKWVFKQVGESINITNRKQFIHPQIREYVKLQLEQQASKAAVRQAVIDRLN